MSQHKAKENGRRTVAPPAVYNKAEALAFCEQWLLAGKEGAFLSPTRSNNIQ